MATEELDGSTYSILEQNARQLEIGYIIDIGSTPYKVEGVEYDGDEEYIVTLKPANKHYLTPEDFIYLTMNYRHLIRVKIKSTERL